MFAVYILVIIAMLMDLKYKRISNRLILGGMGIALVWRFCSEGFLGAFTAVLQISFPVIILYLLFWLDILGAGDIKLFSLIGGFVNFKILVWCIIYAFVIAAVFASGLVVCSVVRRDWRCHRMCFSGFILMGLLMAHCLKG